MALRDFALPDLGEGLTEGEILHWLVAEGEQIRLNQPIVEVETAKAAVEVPSPYAGRVVRLHHPEGSTVDVGSALITVDDAASGGTPTPAAPGTPPEAAPGTPPEADLVPDLSAAAAPERQAVLVGYGPRTGAARRRPRRAPEPSAAVPPDSASDDPAAPEPAAPEHAAPVLPPARVSAAVVAAAAPRLVLASDAPRGPVLAKPPVRKLARTLGVDLHAVIGSGPSGTVTRDDVELAATHGSDPASPAAPAPSAPRGARRVAIRGVRKATAAKMVESAFTAPHVTEFLTVDATATVALVGRLSSWPEFAGLRVTPLTLVARAFVLAVRRRPEINATWDGATGEIVVKDYVNLGIAAATPRGLIVPNVKDADLLSLPDLARALTDLVGTAREGRTTPADLTGGTVTISNVGVFGVDTGTPILNPGESAILAVGAIRERPWVHEGALAVRQVVQLALSFDHRVVDGELGSRVLADVGAAITEPERMLAWV